MKQLINFLKEGLKLTSKLKVNEQFTPSDAKELRDEILNRYKENKSSLDLSDINVSKITNFSNVCCKLDDAVEIDVTGWDVTNANMAKSLFAECRYLKTIKGLETWDVSNIEDMSFMFNNCRCLTNIGDLSGWEVNGTKTICMFQDCKRLKSIGDIRHWRPQTSNWEMFVLCDIKPQPKNRI